MTWDELKIFIKGKLFLIGITFIDKDENVIEKYQTFGNVVELSDEGIFSFLRPDNSVFKLPYDRESIKKAEEGEYREKSSGRVIENPDYITSWDIYVKDENRITEIKETGFIPPQYN